MTPSNPVTAARTRLFAAVSPRFRVEAGFDLEVERPPERVWTLLADLPRFLEIDPFHARVTRLAPAAGPLGPLAIEHRAFGPRFHRFGRVLSHREGRGYAVSDLSARPGRRGFPHVFSFDLEPAARPRSSRLAVRVRGAWTARWVPRPLVRLWLLLVCREHARLLLQALRRLPA